MYHRQRFPIVVNMGNGLGKSLFLRVTQEDWLASPNNHSFEAHSCVPFRRMVFFGGWCRTIISLGNNPDIHSLGQIIYLEVALFLVLEEWPRVGNGPGSTIRDMHSLGQTHSLQVALCLVSEEWPMVGNGPGSEIGTIILPCLRRIVQIAHH
jgi:hypothetical protein